MTGFIKSFETADQWLELEDQIWSYMMSSGEWEKRWSKFFYCGERVVPLPSAGMYTERGGRPKNQEL